MSDFNFSIPGLMEMQSPISDSLPPIIPLTPHSASDTLWYGIQSIGPVTVDGMPFTAPAAVAELVFSRIAPFYDRDQPLVLSSVTGAVSIDGAAAWLFSVPPQPLPLAVGTWRWTFSVTDTEGVTKKLYEDDILITP